MNDPETECIVMIGEIGGQLEADAAQWIKADGNRKPVVGSLQELLLQQDAMGMVQLLGSMIQLKLKNNHERMWIHVVDSSRNW
jgi:succinyl-CoA synthetase alpha subunit